MALLVFAPGELPDDPEALGLGVRSIRLSLPQMDSWIGSEANQPVTTAQVASAIGEEGLSGFAEALGQEPADLAEKLAAVLPTAVDEASSSDPSAEQPPVSGKRAGSDVLLVLFDSMPDAVAFREPGEGLHFGLDQGEPVAQPSGRALTDLWQAAGPGPSPAVHFTVRLPLEVPSPE
ncbi:YidB family protein [Streptomyces sp. NPDC056255]|uniref:YidB family protein n=1 Tax=Streptomyces sp. NPDC056255 TaxID=3345764 RepID=UPI0035DA41D4